MTDMHKSEGLILKTDRNGRVRTPVERRESLLDEFERSGLSGVKFAALAGIKYQTFAAWAARRRKRTAVKAAGKRTDQLRWLEAVVAEAQTPVMAKGLSLMVHLPGGARLELTDVQQVPVTAALLHSLAKSC